MDDSLLFILPSLMTSYLTEGKWGVVSVVGDASVVILSAGMSNVIPVLSLSHDLEDGMMGFERLRSLQCC